MLVRRKGPLFRAEEAQRARTSDFGSTMQAEDTQQRRRDWQGEKQQRRNWKTHHMGCGYRHVYYKIYLGSGSMNFYPLG